MFEKAEPIATVTIKKITSSASYTIAHKYRPVGEEGEDTISSSGSTTIGSSFLSAWGHYSNIVSMVYATI